MRQVVQAKCPGCGSMLRIPADWVGQSLRCKRCGTIIRAKQKAAATPLPADPAATNAAAASIPPANGFVPSAMAAVANTVRSEPPLAATAGGPAPATGQNQAFAQIGDGDSPLVQRYRRRARRRAWQAPLVAACIMAVLAGVAVWAIKALTGQATNGSAVPESHKASHGPANGGAPRAAEFPRRALAISVNNYWYANPVTYGDKERGVGPVLKRLADAFRIPSGQAYELSDGAAEPRTPTKEIIQSTITDFLYGSRAQDRVLVLFVGQAVEMDSESFLVPVDGEIGVKETLIPLAWLYEELAKCKARQKVLIMDVCCFDPARGQERPGSEAMGDKLAGALQNPPAGVQVWSACSAQQYSYEGSMDSLHVGFFINELYEALGPSQTKRVNLGIQKPEDPLPVELLANGKGEVRGVNRETEAVIEESLKLKQTPVLSGQKAADGAAYDPNEPLPDKLVIKQPAPPADGAAPGLLIQQILEETGTKATRDGGVALNVKILPAFSAKVMQAYQDSAAKTPFRQAVVKAAAVLKKHSGTLQYQFFGKGDDAAIKKLITEVQKRTAARVIAELMDAVEELQKTAEQRSKESSKRWQANYDLVLAKLHMRIAYVNEYDFMLGQIKKDALPPRDPMKHSGWQLASQRKLQSGSEARKRESEARKILQKLAKENKGTPYETLAKREALTFLGMQWQPVPSSATGS